MKKLPNFKKDILPHIVSILLLFAFSCILFYPQLSGEKIQSSDIVSSTAKTKLVKDYKERTGETSYWNPSQFSGGPIYLLNLGKDKNLLGIIHYVFTINNMHAIGMFFALGLAMYLSLCLMGVNKWLSLTISVAYMLNLVFFTLLEAGHNKKVHTLIYLPLVISGLVNLFKNSLFRGSFALLLGTSLAIYTGHIQMVYYLLISLIGFGLPFLIFAIIDKKLKTFLPGFGVALLIAIIAASTNFAQLYSSQSFSKQTMRGGAVIEDTSQPADAVNEKGLQWTYAMNWSYELKDFFNIIVPRIVGGGSQEYVDKENDLAQLMMKNNAPVVKGKVGVPGYWSSMPFTSGGAYIGASLLLLFVFSLFLIKREISLAFIFAFLTILFLSLGENASWFNRLLFNHAPLFDKFRAPSSAISILPGFIALAVGLGLQTLFEDKTRKGIEKKLFVSVGIIGGFVLLIYVVGAATFSFLSPNDLNYPYEIQQTLAAGRKALLQADAIRSLGFILATGALVWLYLKGKIKKDFAFLVVLTLIFVIDILPIDRRYVDSENFISEQKYLNNYTPRAVDQQITQLEPNGRPFYRVLDLSVNTFNDAIPSYHHNQIGGYDPAKLQRFQDLIDYHIRNNNFKVLNMLNMKYIISKEGKVQTNPQANGNAWFVNKIQEVSNAQDEIDALDNISKDIAVINTTEFKEVFAGDGEGDIKLKEGDANRLVYTSSSNSNQLAVFSEIWYGGTPDWKVWIDGDEVSLLRANYILRALEIPSGEHEIIMEFKPEAKGSFISLGSSLLSYLILLVCLLIIIGIIKNPTVINNEVSV